MFCIKIWGTVKILFYKLFAGAEIFWVEPEPVIFYPEPEKKIRTRGKWHGSATLLY